MSGYQLPQLSKSQSHYSVHSGDGDDGNDGDGDGDVGVDDGNLLYFVGSIKFLMIIFAHCDNS